ncbi:MAG TPA: DegT/DnrJ/EryC1/StrS family aminotransferase [candidate division Zixibacteria bacterium]|nr:DegT/DnrJ/EryC1/StrS family aminotransferase [candidate division Zixibacteria bacterium]
MSDAYRIPIVDLRAQYRVIETEVRAALDEVLQSQRFVLGPAVARFEERFAAYLRGGRAVGVASGSDALLLALMALGIGPGDGVLVPTFTFFSTASAVVRLGARPLFLDIDPKSYTLSAADVAEFLDRSCREEEGRLKHPQSGTTVRAILPVHLFGRCAPMPDLCETARRRGLWVVEDVAQACGARLVSDGGEKLAGTFGDFGCFSFFPSKTLGGYGDGGAVVAASEAAAERLRVLRMHGERVKYRHELIGINSRLDSLQAAVLSVKLRHLDRWCAQRVERAATYDRLFRESGLPGAGILALPELCPGLAHVFNHYVVRAERRDDLRSHLADRAIQAEIYYPLPLHLQPSFAHFGHRPGDFPRAERASREVLALPLYPELSDAQQRTVVEAVAEFYRV